MKKISAAEPDVATDVTPADDQPPQETAPPGGGSFVREPDGTLTRVKD